MDDYRTVTDSTLKTLGGFKRLDTDFLGTLTLSIDKELAELESATADTRLKSCYNRLNQILGFVSSYDDKRKYNKDSVRNFILTGANTAAMVMGRVLYLLPSAYGHKYNSRDLVRIAKNTYPLIAKLAMGNVDTIPQAFRALDADNFSGMPSSSFFKPKYFTIDGDNGNPRLSFSKEGEERLKDMLGVSKVDLRAGETPTVGCPAMVNFGDNSAVKLLWDWHTEIAEKVYPSLVKKDRVKTWIAQRWPVKQNSASL